MSKIEKIFATIESQFMGQSSEKFSDKVVELAYEPLNSGEIENPDGEGYAKGECGDSMTIFIKTENHTITDARFLSDGCGATLACGSAVTELVKNHSPFEARKVYPQTVIKFLNGLPDSHTHCSILAVQALRKALENLDSKMRGQ